MADIVSEAIDRYAEAHTTPPTELQRRLADETRETLRSPQMLTGVVEGRLLEFLVFALRPQRVLELGTYSGYSSLAMASVLPPGGHIDTCEVEEAHAEVARRYLDEAGVGDRVTIHLGPALETIERLGGEFDLVFIDADKVSYPAYYDALVPRLAAGGIMVLDNTLWSGRVLDPGDAPEAQMFAELNARIASDPRVTAVLLTVRDGVTLVRRAQGS
jgi:caffeoyl-CoA O-methyltransferase